MEAVINQRRTSWILVSQNHQIQFNEIKLPKTLSSQSSIKQQFIQVRGKQEIHEFEQAIKSQSLKDIQVAEQNSTNFVRMKITKI